MDAAEWDASTDPAAMIAALSKATVERKVRLFACASARCEWRRPDDERLLQVVEVVERFADGEVTFEDLSQVLDRAAPAFQDWTPAKAGASWVLAATVRKGPLRFVATVCGVPTARIDPAVQARILRDVFGNPFRPVAFNPAWLAGPVPDLAEAAYTERIMPSGELGPVRLAVLADALEDNGADPAILDHLRGPGPHVRGCWVVDLCTERG
jgi:hypothetical protein